MFRKLFGAKNECCGECDKEVKMDTIIRLHVYVGETGKKVKAYAGFWKKPEAMTASEFSTEFLAVKAKAEALKNGSPFEYTFLGKDYSYFALPENSVGVEISLVLKDVPA